MAVSEACMAFFGQETELNGTVSTVARLPCTLKLLI